MKCSGWRTSRPPTRPSAARKTRDCTVRVATQTANGLCSAPFQHRCVCNVRCTLGHTRTLSKRLFSSQTLNKLNRASRCVGVRREGTTSASDKGPAAKPCFIALVSLSRAVRTLSAQHERFDEEQTTVHTRQVLGPVGQKENHSSSGGKRSANESLAQ